MNTKLKEFSKLSKRQQSRRIKSFIASKMSIDNNESVQKKIFTQKANVTSDTNISSPSIIRIVPSSTKKMLPAKNEIKTFLVQRPNNPKVQSVPSTSNSKISNVFYAADHLYHEKAAKIQDNDDKLNECEEVANNDSITSELETVPQKPILIGVKRYSENNISTTIEKINKVHSEQCCCSCRETLDIILRQQQEILSCLKKDQGIIPIDRKLDLLPVMPFDDINDFFDFDESLNNENVQDQFLIKLKRLLVSTEQKSISNIMASIMTNELCRTISWTGIKNTVPFGSTNMVGLILVSSKSEQQQQTQQQLGAAVSELRAAAQSNSGNSSVVPTSTTNSSVASSEDAEDSAEVTDYEDGQEKEEDEEEENGGGLGEEEEDEDGDDEGAEREEEQEEGEAEGDDEYEDELRAVAALAKKPTAAVEKPPRGQPSAKEPSDKEVSELLEYKKSKKPTALESSQAAKDKRVPTVKKELSSQKEILAKKNGTQAESSHPVHDDQASDRVDVEVPKVFMKNELQETENYEGSTYAEQQQQKQQQQQPSIERAYTVLRPSELLRKLSKRQDALLNDLKAYLLDEYVAEREKLQELGSEEGLLAKSLLKLLAKLAENPQRWERVHQLLTDIKTNLDFSRQAIEAQKRLVQVADPFVQEMTSTLTTSMPPSATDRPSRKPRKKKKKKKKKKLRHRKLSTTAATSTTTTTTMTTEGTANPLPPAMLALATTDTPWSTTHPSAAKAKWRLVAERLFEPPWSQEDLRDDVSNVAKVRYSMPAKPRTLSPGSRRPLDDKERESLKALNSERQALMLKAAREYSQPRLLHYGKINTHQQTSSAEDLEDGGAYDSNERAYQRAHFGQLSSPSSVRLGYPRAREHVLPVAYPEQPAPQPASQPFDVNFARNQEYLPPGRDFAASKPWQGGGNPFRYESPWSKLAEPKGAATAAAAWNWRQFSNAPAPVVPKPWLPWHTERDYFARLQEEEEETAKAWQQAQQRQQQQNWNRQNMRDNLPPWLEEQEVQRMLHTPDSWSKPEKSREYGMHHEPSIPVWENNRNNNSDLKSSSAGSKQQDDSKESPKLTMKTWNSLTSDPATWPFKLPGAKPWPKDENGKSYNPNAELVRKLGLYKNGRLRPDKDALKDLKQQTLQKINKQDEVIPANDTRTLPWAGKAAPAKGTSWNEPEKQQSWYNGMKLHENFEDADQAANDRSSHWNNEGPASASTSGRMWSREKLPDAWNLAKAAAAAATWSNTWPAKWKQFAYHKVTAQPTSKSGVTLDKPNKNAFIAVSAVSSPRYGNEWRKNDIEEIGQMSPGAMPSDPNDPTSQMRMNVWKKSSGINGTIGAIDKASRIDVLENQLEDLKEKEGPVLLEVNVSIKNSTFHETSTPSPSTSSTLTEKAKAIETKTKDDLTPKENHQTKN